MGNSLWKLEVNHAAKLDKRGIFYRAALSKPRIKPVDFVSLLHFAE